MTATELIVLHTTKVGENSIVLHTLSREYGRRSFIVKGMGSSRKGASASLFLPMSIIEAEIVESSKSQLYQARRLSSAQGLLGIRSNLYKNSITMFLSEVLFRAIKDGGREDGLYEWCKASLVLLDAMESDFSNFHLRFLLELAVAMGFTPSYEGMLPFVQDNREKLREMMEGSFGESMLVPLSGAERNEMAEGLLRYLEFHSESSLKVNSLKVLREIFA